MAMTAQTTERRPYTLPECMDEIHYAISSLVEEARKTGPQRMPNGAWFSIHWVPESDSFGWSISRDEPDPPRPGRAVSIVGGNIIEIRRRLGKVYNSAFKSLLMTYGAVRANPDWGV